MTSLPLDGQVAIVTGAVGLLGRRHCAALSMAGAQVVAVDLDEAACDALAREIAAASGSRALGTACNVVDRHSIEKLLARVEEAFGPADILVNNAALDDKVTAGPRSAIPFEVYPLEKWEASLRVNLTGPFLCCQVIGGAMAMRGSGSVINIASTYGMVAPDQSLYRSEDGTQTFIKSAAYPCAKSGLIALTRYLAAYWGRAGVRVNALSPGGVENGQDQAFVARYSERTPLGRMAKPGDYEGALVFLAGSTSTYMTGANLVVDGGFTAW
jgi:NAD(P)-dependent dehydrogenase (short-subunit alcohol dehydrogenase family)